MITTTIYFFWHGLHRVALALRTPCLIALGFLLLLAFIAGLMIVLYLLLSQIQ